ncbi:MAG TPA: hypothetical protein VK130_02940 [Steroidobacteraceae bacterium]|nr:hypothetical protein [Steroidobacteraceae bacterium]
MSKCIFALEWAFIGVSCEFGQQGGNMRAAYLALILGLYGTAAWSAEASGDAAYREAFYKSILSTIKQVVSVSPDFAKDTPQEREKATTEMAKALTECHMRAMAAYSPTLQNVAYRVIAAGGSYADAKEAFDRALATEGAAGGDRAWALKAMVEKAVSIGQGCNKAAVRAASESE